MHEPSKAQWTDRATGLPCLAVRNAYMGHWCGYVGLGPDHPFYGRIYDDVPWVEVHGGLTYSAACDEGDEAVNICHVPLPGQPDHVWWLGFDCGHSGDLSPGMAARMREYDDLYKSVLPDSTYLGLAQRETYRTLGYVREECARLAEQLAALRRLP